MTTEIATESGHWYTRAGEPAYTVASAKDGAQRPTTLRDARKLALIPSVTTIIRCAAAPGLERWKVDQAMNACLTLPRLPDETQDAFKVRALRDSQEQASKAAKRGSDLHTAIERELQGKPVDPIWQEHVRAVHVACIAAGIDLRAGESERSFAHHLGYGGKVDWHSRGDQNIVLDFKSKDAIADEKKLAWPEQAMQLAAYSTGLHLSQSWTWHARCVNVFIGVTDRKVHVHEWDEFELSMAWQKFQHLLAYWQLDKGYQSGWTV